MDSAIKSRARSRETQRNVKARRVCFASVSIRDENLVVLSEAYSRRGFHCCLHVHTKYAARSVPEGSLETLI